MNAKEWSKELKERGIRISVSVIRELLADGIRQAAVEPPWSSGRFVEVSAIIRSADKMEKEGR